MELTALIATSIAATATGIAFAYFLMRRTVAAVAVSVRKNRYQR